LSAKFQILFFLVGANCSCGFLAQSAGFAATFFFAEARNVFADILHVFGLEDSAVCANQQAEFPGHDARFDVFDTIKNFFPHFFSA
jgi:hypothetical protein